jgi:EmrB/QacA subfamily drug resistance transporter
MGMTTTRRWILALTSIASLMVALDALVVTTALSTIRTDLGASIEQLEWTVNGYTLSFAVLLMTGALLGDRFGRRRMFVAGIALFTAASAACALAPGIGTLIAARVVQGAGAALVMPLALALLTAGFPPEQRGKAMGLFSAVTGLAVLGGPVVGGAITEGLAWEWIFWLNVPIGLAVIPLALSRLEESFGPQRPLDLPGIALVTGAALGIVWGLVRGNSAGWGSLEVAGMLAIGVLLTIGFVAWERRAPAPMLPMGVFRSRGFSAGNATNFFQFASLFGAVFFMAQFLQVGLGYGPLGTGLRLLAWTATLTLVAPFAGVLADKLGERPFMVAGLALQGLGMAWIALIATPGMAYGELIAPLIVTGSGTSMAMPAIQSAVLGAVAPSEVGQASGTFTMLRQLGAAFGLAVLVAVFAGAGSYASPAAFADGFVPAIAVSAGLALAGALAALVVPARRRERVVAVAMPEAG